MLAVQPAFVCVRWNPVWFGCRVARRHRGAFICPPLTLHCNEAHAVNMMSTRYIQLDAMPRKAPPALPASLYRSASPKRSFRQWRGHAGMRHRGRRTGRELTTGSTSRYTCLQTRGCCCCVGNRPVLPLQKNRGKTQTAVRVVILSRRASNPLIRSSG